MKLTKLQALTEASKTLQAHLKSAFKPAGTVRSIFGNRIAKNLLDRFKDYDITPDTKVLKIDADHDTLTPPQRKAVDAVMHSAENLRAQNGDDHQVVPMAFNRGWVLVSSNTIFIDERIYKDLLDEDLKSGLG